MTTAIISSKGRIAIPVEIRKTLKLDADDRIEFLKVEPGRHVFTAATRSVTELKGV